MSEELDGDGPEFREMVRELQPQYPDMVDGMPVGEYAVKAIVEIARLKEELAIKTAAIQWALTGIESFKAAGVYEEYWWRPELARRAGMEIAAHLKPKEEHVHNKLQNEKCAPGNL